MFSLRTPFGKVRRSEFGRKVEECKMKKTYEIPELKIALLAKADIIVTSDNVPGEDDGQLPIMP